MWKQQISNSSVKAFWKNSLPSIQFHWQFLITNSCFWLVSILLRKFDTSSKMEMKMIKNTNVMTKNNTKIARKFVIIWSSIICSCSGLALLTCDVICSKVLREEENITDQKLSEEHSPRVSYVRRFISI